MTNETIPEDPTEGELPATEFPEDEFPDPPQTQDEFGPDGEQEVGA